MTNLIFFFLKLLEILLNIIMFEGKASYLLSPYFIINILLIFTYPVLRLTTSAGRRSLKVSDSFGFTYQNSIIYTVLALSLLNYAKAASNTQFFIDFLTAGKIGIACLLFFAKWQYSLYYLIVCTLTWLVIPYPKFHGKNNFKKIKSVEQFQQILSERCKKKQEQKNFLHYQYHEKKMYMVEFYADWMLNCTFAKQIWYGFSNKYETPQLKFLSVNISKVPKLAQKYRINISGFSKQLPTVIIFEDGEENIRFPPIDKNGKVPKVVKYDYKILLRYFDLESRYIETRDVGK